MGDVSAFDPQLRDLIAEVERVSEDRTGMVLNIALNYGGRAEIVRAVQGLLRDVQSGALPMDAVDEKALSDRMYTAGEPDPDLIIRTSGERRFSNFLLWQSAYAEFCATDVLWPDFKPEDLERALDDYAARRRRFGGI